MSTAIVTLNFETKQKISGHMGSNGEIDVYTSPDDKPLINVWCSLTIVEGTDVAESKVFYCGTSRDRAAFRLVLVSTAAVFSRDFLWIDLQ